MATDKPRIQVTLDKTTNGILSLLAKKQAKSRSAVAAALIEQALELQEDFHFSKLAEKREAAGGKRVKHDDVWKSIQD